jgi:hypothetical protein
VDLIVTTKNDGYTKALLQILEQHTAIDLRNFIRPESSKPLWQEMRELQRTRNLILHQAGDAGSEEAERGIAIAHCLLGNIFHRVIEKIGLHLHDDRVCGAQCFTDDFWNG